MIHDATPESLSVSLSLSLSPSELMVPHFSFIMTMQSMEEIEFEGVQLHFGAVCCTKGRSEFEQSEQIPGKWVNTNGCTLATLVVHRSVLEASLQRIGCDADTRF